MTLLATRRAGLALTAAALAVIAVATLVPQPSEVPLVAQTPIWCIVCGQIGTIDILLNVALFLPLGAGLVMLGVPWRRAVLIGAALSLAIETTQYFAIAGRDASLGDLLTNTAGAALGAFLATTWRPVLFPSPSQAAALSAAAAIAWLAQVAVTGAAVLPSLPRSVYWGQRAPDLPQFEQFRGELLDASVGDAPFPYLRMRNSAEIRWRLLRGEALSAVVAPAGPTRALAPIVSIFDGSQREIALLGQWRADLVFRLRSRAFDFRLRPPAVRLPAVFHGLSNDTLRVGGALEGRRLVVQASGQHARVTRQLDLSAQWGWSLLLPFPYAFGTEVGWLTGLWVGCWLLPMGYWLSRTGIGLGGAATVGAAALAAGIAGVPAFFGLRGSVWDWVAGGGGLAAGGWLARRARLYATAPPSARSASSP